MECLKNKVEAILRNNKIYFDLQYHHKGHLINIKGADGIKDDLENWIGYDVLTEYLIGKDILYNFSGFFDLNEGEILIYLFFTGPYDEEFEPLEMPIKSIFSGENLEKELKSIILTDINYSELFIKFVFDETKDFSYFEIYYWDVDSNYLEITEKLALESVYYIKDYIKKFVDNNVPNLNLTGELKQNYYAECEENIIRYYINTSQMVIKWDDAVENYTN